MVVTSDARVLEEFFEDCPSDARAAACYQPFADVEYQDAGRERWLGPTYMTSMGDGPLEQELDAARAEIVHDERGHRGHMLGELRRSGFVVDEDAFRALPFQFESDDELVDRVVRFMRGFHDDFPHG